MEDPQTWTQVEQVIDQTLKDWHYYRKEGLVGFSQARLIADALRDAGLLRDSSDEISSLRSVIQKLRGSTLANAPDG